MRVELRVTHRFRILERVLQRVRDTPRIGDSLIETLPISCRQRALENTALRLQRRQFGMNCVQKRVAAIRLLQSRP